MLSFGFQELENFFVFLILRVCRTKSVLQVSKLARLTGYPNLIVVENSKSLHSLRLTVKLQQARDGLRGGWKKDKITNRELPVVSENRERFRVCGEILNQDTI